MLFFFKIRAKVNAYIEENDARCVIKTKKAMTFTGDRSKSSIDISF